jgi:hypothetical protein
MRSWMFPFWSAIAVAALASCSSPDQAAPDVAARALRPSKVVSADNPARPFVGSYELVDKQAGHNEVANAIERVVSQMNFLARGIARDRISSAVVAPEKLEVKAVDDLIEIATDRFTNSAPVDGTALNQKVSSGEMMDVSIAISDALEQTFKGDGKGQVNRFELDGDKLTMHARIYSDQLPAEIVFDLEFRRVQKTAELGEGEALGAIIH